MNKYAILDELDELGIGFKPTKTEDELIAAINSRGRIVSLHQTPSLKWWAYVSNNDDLKHGQATLTQMTRLEALLDVAMIIAWEDA